MDTRLFIIKISIYTLLIITTLDQQQTNRSGSTPNKRDYLFHRNNQLWKFNHKTCFEIRTDVQIIIINSLIQPITLIKPNKRLKHGQVPFISGIKNRNKWLAIILLLSGDIELNPGPPTLRHNNKNLEICETCNKRCTNKNAIKCDNCQHLIHKNCIGMMNNQVVKGMQNNSVSWICADCGAPNHSTTFFNNSLLGTSNKFSLLEDSKITPDFQPKSTSTPKEKTKKNNQNKKQKTLKKKNNQQNKQKSKRFNLTNLVINFQSLKNKKAELHHMTHEYKPDIIIGTETWLTPDIKNTELLLDDYNVYRKDRNNNKRGGGVLIAVKNNITSELIQSKEGQNNESIYCKIKTADQKTLIIGSIYRPPNTKIEEITKICQELTSIVNSNKKSLYWIGGDFNLPEIDWMSESCKAQNKINDTFLDTIKMLGLKQTINFKTHDENILDLFLTNNPGLITYQKPIAGLGDHEAIIINSNITAERKKTKPHKIFLWNKCNITNAQKEITEMTQKFLKTFNKDSNVNEMWTFLKKRIEEIIEKHVPTKMTSKKHQQPWFTTLTNRLTRKKKRWFQRMKNTNSERVKNKYKEIKRTTQKALRSAHSEYVKNMICNDNKDNKKLWTYIKSKRQEQVGIPDLIDDNNKTIKDPKEKANILNNQFSNVFSNPEPEIICKNNPNLEHAYSQMNAINVKKEGVLKLLLNIKENKATGPDGIPGRILKLCAPEIVDAYVLLFQTSLDQGKVPNDWKDANIIPIFKKGNKTKAENYRPVSLTSITCKLLEHIIHSNIMDHLDKNNILNKIQHGFRQKRSCETQLITTINDLSNCLNERGQTDAILLDFSKAFDKVDHLGLINKMKNYGISDNLIHWTKSFLIGRNQKVTVEGVESNTLRVKSGVPQGTVLGPLFFLLYINDINLNLTPGTKMRLFADDSLLYRQIRSTEDCEILQNDLNILQNWEKKWKMEFHPQKCQLLTITKKQNPIKAKYYVHGEALSQTKSAKYLGVIIDSELNWKDQNKAVCKKANSILAFLKRNISNCPQPIKEKCYKTLVKPILEYGCCVWDPHTKKYIEELEKTHKNAARFVTNNYNYISGNTKNNMNKLGWIPLEEQRARNKVNLFYKGIHNTIDIPTDQYQTISHRIKTRQNECQMYNIPYSKINCHLHSFFPSTIRLWNSVPTGIKASETTEAFKQALTHITLKSKY